MRIAASANVLTEAEAKRIHKSVVEVLSKIGLIIEYRPLLEKLADFGAEVNFDEMRLKFSGKFLEKFFDESRKFNWENVEPVVTARAGIYQGKYLDPETGEFLPWTEQLVSSYAKLARSLPDVDGSSMLGCPVEGVRRDVIPLEQRRICWKYGMGPGGSIWNTALCPYILEMCDVMAAEKGKPASDYFRGMVFYTSTLKLPKSEAEQFVYFAERGLRVSIDSMTSGGGSAPVTLAGAVVVHLAEVLTSNIIHRAYYGGNTLWLSSTIAPYDMRTLIYAYGRPEREICNMIIAGMAKFYSSKFYGHTGHTDAKRPGPEAAAQKALTTIPTLLAGGRTQVCAGLLSSDEICSPLQMVLDDEFTGALKRLAHGCSINDETIALDEILEVGPGNLFLERPHTAKHFRSELWMPELWTRDMFEGWKQRGAKTALDKALDFCRDVAARPEPEPSISPETEKRLEEIISRAAKKIGNA